MVPADLRADAHFVGFVPGPERRVVLRLGRSAALPGRRRDLRDHRARGDGRGVRGRRGRHARVSATSCGTASRGIWWTSRRTRRRPSSRAARTGCWSTKPRGAAARRPDVARRRASTGRSSPTRCSPFTLGSAAVGASLSRRRGPRESADAERALAAGRLPRPADAFARAPLSLRRRGDLLRGGARDVARARPLPGHRRPQTSAHLPDLRGDAISGRSPARHVAPAPADHRLRLGDRAPARADRRRGRRTGRSTTTFRLSAALLFIVFTTTLLDFDALAANCELYMLLPLTASVLLYLRGFARARTAELLGAGVLVGVAALYKYQAAVHLPLYSGSPGDRASPSGGPTCSGAGGRSVSALPCPLACRSGP